MKINSDFVGSKLKEFRTEITWRQTMNYAAAVGDNNPWYVDDTRADGIIAPPMLATAVTWKISGRIWEFFEAKDFPAQALMTQVHYLERLEFHRPMRPGDKLTVTGEIAAIVPHRAGTLIVIRYDASDAAGSPVFTNHTGALLRGVECADNGRGAHNVPAPPQKPAGDSPVWEHTLHIDPLAAHVYDGCADIVFPIHTSKKFARGVGLPGTILQGTATLALAARELINTEAGADPRRLASIRCRFSAMVLPGTDIKIVLEDRRERDSRKQLVFSVVNAQGKKAISDGTAEIML